MMPALALRFLDEHDGRLRPRPLELVNGNGRLAVRGRSLPGVDRFCVTLEEEGTARRRWEIVVDHEEDVVFHLDAGEDGSVELFCDERTVYTLPPEERYEPPPPIPRPEPPDGGLDVAVVLDATTRVDLPVPDGSPELLKGFLLDDEERRDDFLGRLEALLERLAERHADVRLAAIAFGDHPMPPLEVQADELKPRFLLEPKRPDARKLRAWTPAELTGFLRQVPSTPGGDYVDALAHALWAACELRWRPEARKLLILSGDSPGHSTEHPLPPEADLCTRVRDVDLEALRLHGLGVEVMTIYHDPRTSSGVDLGNEQVRRLLDGTREQYARLASYPAVALAAASFDPQAAAEAVLGRPALIGRRASYGVCVEVAATGPG